MSVSLWDYSPEKCDGRPCVGDCDKCNYEPEESKVKKCFGIPKDVAEMLLEDTEGINRDVETIITGDTDSDYVKVVRCKDCRYYLKGKIYPDAGLWCHKLADGLDMPPDGYCSYGERKETE